MSTDGQCTLYGRWGLGRIKIKNCSRPFNMANSISFKTRIMRLQNAEEITKIGLPSQILLNNTFFILSCPWTGNAISMDGGGFWFFINKILSSLFKNNSLGEKISVYIGYKIKQTRSKSVHPVLSTGRSNTRIY